MLSREGGLFSNFGYYSAFVRCAQPGTLVSNPLLRFWTRDTIRLSTPAFACLKLVSQIGARGRGAPNDLSTKRGQLRRAGGFHATVDHHLLALLDRGPARAGGRDCLERRHENYRPPERHYLRKNRSGNLLRKSPVEP